MCTRMQGSTTYSVLTEDGLELVNCASLALGNVGCNECGAGKPAVVKECG